MHFFQKPRHIALFSLRFLHSILKKPNPFPSSIRHRLFSSSANPLIHFPNPNPNPGPDSPSNFSLISNLFTDPSISHGSVLHAELDRSGIEPGLSLLHSVFDHFGSSPKLLHSLFLWAENQPGFKPDPKLFDSMVNVLAKSKEFHSAWNLIRDHVEEENFVSIRTFAILIRRYACAGMPQPAIQTFEYVRNNTSILDSTSEMSLFGILLDSLCKEGSVREASEYFFLRKETDPSWVPAIHIYNIMLNGLFRLRKLKQGERFWEEMKEENVRPSVVTYGTLVKGYCRMGRVEKALEMVGDMAKEGIEPNAIVYNPIIDALAEAGRFEEALGMIERFHVLDIGPTESTYNSLVKGFCKKGDFVGANTILKMMTSRGFVPSATTYNYFFRYFSRCGKIEEGMNLYKKMIESGYMPNRLTYHLLVKMLCEEERLDLAVQVSKEMRDKGYDMYLSTSTMLVHLLCKMHRLEEASAEFEDMIRRGIVPHYLTFLRMNAELKERGMTEIAQRLCGLMSSVPHSTKLLNTYEQAEMMHKHEENL